MCGTKPVELQQHHRTAAAELRLREPIQLLNMKLEESSRL
jgi:hypothetical protein